MKRYEEYKDSNILWLGKLPSLWSVEKINGHFRERREKVSDKDYPALSVAKIGVVPQLDDAVKTDNGDNRKLVREGDFVVNSRSDRKGSCGVSPQDGSVSLINIVLKIIDLNREYVHLLFRSNNYIEEFYRNGRGIVSDLWTTRYCEMKNILIPIPPIEEQEAIVVFLDNKISKIDIYVSEREKELIALEELKQAEIAAAITRGLNPNAPMCDSGIPWLGQIPLHWKELKLSQVAREHYISNKNVHHQNLLSLSYGKIIRKDINRTDGLLPASFDGYQIVEPGNIVLRLTDLQNDQKSLRVGLAREEGIVTGAYLSLEVRDNIIPEFAYLFLHTSDIHKFFYTMGSGIRQGLNFTGIRDIKVPVPPKGEQQDIVDYINAKTQKIDGLIADLKAEIEKLKEYKQRLISDAVTGQIDVRDYKITTSAQ